MGRGSPRRRGDRFLLKMPREGGRGLAGREGPGGYGKLGNLGFFFFGGGAEMSTKPNNVLTTCSKCPDYVLPKSLKCPNSFRTVSLAHSSSIIVSFRAFPT